MQYGIRLYLYLNEPRYVPASFFERYPQARGRHAFQKGYYGMCTSDKDVRDWLSESMYFLFSRVPELGGVILITASEYETNCYSHIPTYDFQAEGLAVGDDRYFGLKHEDTMCPRCAERGPGQVLSDMANIADSARRDAGSKADVVQWLWGWDYIMPPVNVRKTIKKLPPDVKIMVDWQKRTQFNLFGRPGMVDEYTMAYTEPSDYAAEIVSTCRSLNRKLLAKCAIVTTAEMNALPYLPALDNVEKLVRKLRRCGVEGLLGCWVFGSYPARNMELLTVSIEDLSKKYYGRGYRHALSAWQSFSRGMKFFPTVQSVLYYSALSCAPGMKLNMKPEPWRSGMNLMPPEDMEKVSGTLGAEVMIRSFRKTAGYFSNGLKSLKTAIGMAPGKYSDENMRDYGISRACMIHLKSVANYSEFILLRNKLLAHPGDVNLRKSLVKILKDEEKNSRAMLVLMLKDSRIGYEGTTGYFYTAGEIVEKIEMIKEVLKEVRKHTQEATCI